MSERRLSKVEYERILRTPRRRYDSLVIGDDGWALRGRIRAPAFWFERNDVAKKRRASTGGAHISRSSHSWSTVGLRCSSISPGSISTAVPSHTTSPVSVFSWQSPSCARLVWAGTFVPPLSGPSRRRLCTIGRCLNRACARCWANRSPRVEHLDGAVEQRVAADELAMAGDATSQLNAVLSGPR